MAMARVPFCITNRLPCQSGFYRFRIERTLSGHSEARRTRPRIHSKPRFQPFVRVSNLPPWILPGWETRRITSRAGLLSGFTTRGELASGSALTLLEDITCATTASIEAEMGAFLDKFMLGNTNVNTVIRDYPGSYSSINYSSWTAWWGTTNAVLGP
jgi:hypothetical protein